MSWDKALEAVPACAIPLVERLAERFPNEPPTAVVVTDDAVIIEREWAAVGTQWLAAVTMDLRSGVVERDVYADGRIVFGETSYAATLQKTR